MGLAEFIKFTNLLKEAQVGGLNVGQMAPTEKMISSIHRNPLILIFFFSFGNSNPSSLPFQALRSFKLNDCSDNV